MVALRTALAVSLAALVALLALLTALGLGLLPAMVGLLCGVILCWAVAQGLAATGAGALGPADLVTLTRATLACALAALVADPSLGQQAAAVLVPLAVLTLGLDAVDGRVARGTGTTTTFGARFDGEADAFLILVLSVHVAPAYGWWVLVIGAARYGFGLAGWVWPWLRAPLPFRYWRKVVTAVQGIVLVVAAADVLPRAAGSAALVAALALLTESFGRDVLWAWRHRSALLGRADFDAALRGARHAAYRPGEYVGQESFMQAREIRSLAVRAGIGPTTSVLDLCCGVAGPGRFVTAELGCTYLGVDASAGAVELARERAGDLPCRFVVAQVPPVPDGQFDVVLLLETLLAFADKDTLLRGVATALPPGGRFAFTVEEGSPLTGEERAAMPAADTVWLVPLPELIAMLRTAGLHVRWMAECSRPHRATAGALTRAFLDDRVAISARVGERAVDELVTAHRLWSAWLGSGRVRKFAVVAEKAVVADRG